MGREEDEGQNGWRFDDFDGHSFEEPFLPMCYSGAQISRGPRRMAYASTVDSH